MAQRTPITLSFKDPVEGPNTVLVSGKFILVSIDGWGKARFDCASWGLCRAQFIYCTHNNVPVSFLRTTSKAASTVEQDGNGRYYIDVLLAVTMTEEEETQYGSMPVDYPIVFETSDNLGINLTISAGTYLYDKQLGTNGGFRIYLN